MKKLISIELTEKEALALLANPALKLMHKKVMRALHAPSAEGEAEAVAAPVKRKRKKKSGEASDSDKQLPLAAPADEE